MLILNLQNTMATYNKILDNRNKTTNAFPLKIAISHRKKTRYIPTGYYLTLEQWDNSKKIITSKYTNSGSANAKVNRKFAITGETIEALRPHWKQLNVDQIKEAVMAKVDEEFEQILATNSPLILNIALESKKADNTCFYEYANNMVKTFYRKDKGGSAGILESTIKSVKAFTKLTKLPFKNITEEFMNDYESWYLKQFNNSGEKNNINGFGFKAKDIRLVYNKAIKDKACEDVTDEQYPFGRKGYSIKKEKTDNKNVSPHEIAKFYGLKLTRETRLWHHHNFFLYYFECWGMNFIDLAYLRVYQVQNGRLKYRRRKTKWSNNAKQFDIEHSPAAQKIIDYYIQGKKNTEFVFPIIDDIFYLTDTLENKDIELTNKILFQKKLDAKRSNHIRRLKALSKKAELKDNISIYVGRHSFFSIALRSGVSKSEISELAGHANYQVTEGYLAGFNNEQLTNSANLVRNAVNQHKKLKQQNSILEEIMMLKETEENISVNDFLIKVWNKSNDQTSLLLELLQKN